MSFASIACTSPAAVNARCVSTMFSSLYKNHYKSDQQNSSYGTHKTTHLVNLGKIIDAVNRIALEIHRLRDSKQPHVSGLLQCAVKFLPVHPLAKNFESDPSRVYHADGF